MPLTKARRAVKRSASARAGGGRSMSMAPPPGPPPLPPGVYFNPTHAESIAFLNRWIAGDDKMPDARGFIFHADMYADDPYALEQLHPPASDRDGKQTWWFLGESKFQSPFSTTSRRASAPPMPTRRMSTTARRTA
ncbi:NAC transcription factor 56-like [Hordeum vulgare subsp. vulgare]|uniref:NAC transcription factor 56-like n=1 Tax=Hordeum vulgare subsp. vulgare TaxID=112509 RepID=UPI001D1A3E91|nr:NAC transcription factor 56-like [Hordeum vulgare subsp. vulgare]